MRLFLAILLAGLPTQGFARTIARVAAVRGAPVALTPAASLLGAPSLSAPALFQAPSLGASNAADLEQTFQTAVEWVEKVEFAASSKKTLAALRSSDATVEQKRAAVAETIALLENACASGCKSAYEVLANLGEQVVTLYEEEAPDELKETVDIPVAQLREAVHKFSNALYRSDPEILQYRLKALLDLLKYLLATQDEAFFALFSPNGGAKAAAGHAGRSGVEFFKQAAVLGRLVFTLREAKKREELGTEEMKRVVGDVQQLGFFYIKLAQSLSNSAIAFQPEAIEQLKFLQDRLPPMEASEVLKVIREDFGQEAGEIFVDFDASKPIASGSVAQTYRAKLRTRWGGLHEVVVKVRRPGLHRRLDQNRILNGVMIRTARVFSEPAFEPGFAFVRDQVRGLEDQFEGELDFVAEGGRTARFRAKSLFRWGIGGSAKVYKGHTTERVLTMESLPGDNVDRMIKRLRRPRAKPMVERHRIKIVRRLFSKLFSTVLDQAFVQREMHADLHPGNILATRRGRLGLVDWSQTFSTKGLLLRPLFLVWHTARGNADKFAKTLARMSQEGFEGQEELQKLSAKAFEKHPAGWAWNWSDEELQAVIATVAGLVRDARGKLGLRLTPGYAQLVRSMVPVFGTLFALGGMLPRGTLIRIMVIKGLLFWPLGLVRRMVNAVVAWPLQRYEAWTDAPVR